MTAYLGCNIYIIQISVLLFSGIEICKSDHLDLKGEILCEGQPVPGVFIEAFDFGEFKRQWY